MLAPLTLDVIQ